MCFGLFKKKVEPAIFSSIFLSLKYHTLEKGKIKSLYEKIQLLNKTNRVIGFAPYCTNKWNKQKEYLKEYDAIPVMLNVMSSDSLMEDECLVKKLSIEQIKEAIKICNVRYLRFHEIMSYHHQKKIDFPLEYVTNVIDLSRKSMIPVFWNEWDTGIYPKIKKIINNYDDSFEDNVIVSFATNNEYMEPVEGYKLLKKFKHKGASVQSWYWWERNERKDRYEFKMPTDLMRLHTSQAFNAGIEIVQYEPMYYFIDDWKPKSQIEEIFEKKF